MGILHLSDSRRQQLWGYAFVLPVVILFAAFRLYPMIRAAVLSFESYDLLTPPRWVGLANYQFIFTNSQTVESLKTSAIFIVGQTIPLVLVALVLALIVFTIPRFRHFFELTFYFPVVMTTVVAAIIWLTLFYPRGLLDQVISPLVPRGVPWLTSPAFAMPSVITVGVWQLTGYYMIILLAGLLGIPAEYLEAAAVDGAKTWSRVWHVILPLLRPQFAFVCILAIINAGQAFDSFYVLTNGGPANATDIVPLEIYFRGFQLLQMGPASALSMVLFVFLMLITLIQLKFFRFQESVG
ncbi:MAG: sugar ABC transporter permease [Candidatus Dormiibacterota bacterium]